jgi:hypothetical protein
LVREYKEAPIINKNLDDIEAIITSIIDGYGLVTPTEAQIRIDYKNRRKNINIEGGGVTDKTQYFVDYAKKFKDEADRKEGTKRTYETTITKLKEYEKNITSGLDSRI